MTKLLLAHPKMKCLLAEVTTAYVERGMGAGFYRHDTKGGGCCRVGGGVGGGSSGRAEFGAACLALEDSLTHEQPIVVLTDSKGLMTKTNATSKVVNATNDALSAGDTTCVEEDSSSEDLAHKLDTKIPALEICRDAKALTVTVPKETVLPVEVSTDKQSTLLQQIRENTNTMLPETHKDIEDTSSKILAQKFCSQPHDDNSIQTKEPNLSEIMQAMQMQIEEKQRQLDAKDKVIEMHVSGMAVKRAAGNEGETTVSKKARVSCSRTDKPEVVPKNIIWNNGIFAWRKRIRKVSAYKGGYKSIAEAQEGLALFCSEMNVGT